MFIYMKMNKYWSKNEFLDKTRFVEVASHRAISTMNIISIDWIATQKQNKNFLKVLFTLQWRYLTFSSFSFLVMLLCSNDWVLDSLDSSF